MFPETPLLLAGAFGGPFCIFLFTPLRNALTLASQDSTSSVLQLYAAAFKGGIHNGWTGGIVTLLPSCPQFLVMGPFFHLARTLVGVQLALLATAVLETLISFRSQTVNAQMAFNQIQVQLDSGLEVPLASHMVLGPGAGVHIVRNLVALSGIRILSEPCLAGLIVLIGYVGLPAPALPWQKFLGDFVASIGAAICSAPLNQLYNFAVTTADYATWTTSEKVTRCLDFLRCQYLSFGAAGEFRGLSPTLFRDLFMRCLYVSALYASFAAIERMSVRVWNKKV